MSNPIQAIFWDVDGTLVDSEPLWAIATFEMSRAMGHELTEAEHATMVGSTWDRTVDRCAELAGVDPEPYRRPGLDRVKEVLASRLQLNPGVRELLDSLREARVPMVVCTNTAREVAQFSIDSVGDYFTDTICGDEVTNPKPAPDIYLEAAHRVGVAPERALVFEDSINGMSAAHSAGCKLVGVTDAPTPGAKLSELSPSGSFVGLTAEQVLAFPLG